MKGGFCFKIYETVFKDCFILSSKYSNGNLQLSLFGVDPAINETAHIADITLNQSRYLLKDNKIIVDCRYKQDFIPQLVALKVLKKQVGTCVFKNCIYPIYTIDLNKIEQCSYKMQELVAA